MTVHCPGCDTANEQTREVQGGTDAKVQPANWRRALLAGSDLSCSRDTPIWPAEVSRRQDNPDWHAASLCEDTQRPESGWAWVVRAGRPHRVRSSQLCVPKYLKPPFIQITGNMHTHGYLLVVSSEPNCKRRNRVAAPCLWSIPVLVPYLSLGRN